MTAVPPAKAAGPPVVVHVTTTDISLALLLGPQLHAFRQAGYRVVGVSAAGTFTENIEKLGVQHVAMRHATRARSLRSDLAALGELRGILRGIRPDIVHTHNPKPGVYGRIAARMAGVPSIVNTVHGLYASRDDRLSRRVAVYAVERLAAFFSDVELVQNAEDLDTLAQLGIPRRRLRLLGNGVDLSRFSLGGDYDERRRRTREEIGASEASVVVSTVGRLVWEKGYRELFEASRRVHEQHPQALFVIAGPTEPSKADGVTPEDISSVDGPGLRFLGYRPDPEDIYAASDLFVLPSYREGFPRSAMEAAAMGLPIVTTDVRGCRQVVEGGRTGLIVPPRDAGALASAISNLVSDPTRRQRMSIAAAEKAKRDFDQQRVIDVTLQVYEELLSRNLTKARSL